jgi:tetratricopeptide (TPR) repeat protein
VPAGREWHLQRLEHDIDALVSGRSGLLLVAGEGGSGKTALLVHAVRAAVERHDDLVVLWGSSSTESHPYQPMMQMTGAAMGMQEHASAEHLVSARNQQRLQERAAIIQQSLATDGRVLVDRLVPKGGREALGTELRQDLAPGAAGGITRTPTPDEYEFLEQGWLSLQRYATAGPVVMVLDNLHLADEGTASILVHLVRRLQHSAAPILVLGAYRPYELRPTTGGRLPPFAGALRELNHFVYDPVISLDTAVGVPHGRAYVAAAIEARVQDAAETLIDEVFALTKGLPLFVDAVLRWYQTGGPATDPPWWENPAADLPAGIDTVVNDLLARLTPPHRQMLEAASVQGTVFSADVLQEVLGISRATLIDDLVTHLNDHARIVEQAGTRTIAGRKTFDFSFSHAPLRDFIHRQLHPTVRRELHRQTALAMIELWGDEPHQGAMHIARQFEQAGDLAQAAGWYLRAGDFHLFRHEHRQAIPFYQRIQDLEVLDVAPFFTVQAMVGLGNCARGLGDLALAQRELAAASTMASQERLPLVEANSLTSLGMVEFDLGQMREGSDHLARAVEIHRQAGERVEVCRSLSLLSHALHGQGRYDDALKAADEAMSLADELDREDLHVYGLVASAECLLTTGDPDGAIDLARRGQVIAEDHGDAHRLVLCALTEAYAWLEQEETARAAQALDQVLARRESINGRMLGAGWFGRGLAALQRGELDDARNLFQQSLELRERHQQEVLQTDSQAGLLRVAIATEDKDAIRTLADSIVRRIEQRGTDGLEQPAALFLALLAAGGALDDERLTAYARLTGQDLLWRRAELLEDPERRHRYLHQVRANRELMDDRQAM